MSRDPWTLALDTSTAGPAGYAVKALPMAPGWSGWGWGGGYDRTALSTYDYARFHSLDTNAIIVLARGWIRRHVGLGRLVVGREEDDGTYAPVDKHPLTMRRQADGRIGLLRRPNPFESWEETLGATVADLIFGNAYWLLPDPRPLADPELYWLPAAFVTVVPETDAQAQRDAGPVRGYRYGGTTYPPSRILHFRDGLDPIRRWMGRNEVAAQIGSAAAVDLLLRFTVAALRNGHAGKVLTPKEAGAVIVEGSPDEAAMIRLADQIEGGLSGENVGRITKTSLPVDLLDAGLGPEEMTLDRIGDLPIALLLGSLGLNMLALDLPGSAAVSTFANKAEAHRHALEYAVITREDLIAGKIASGLLPLYPDPPADSAWWDRRDVEALKENANERASRAVELYAGKVATRNEARGIVDLPPDEEAGDQYDGETPDPGEPEPDPADPQEPREPAEPDPADGPDPEAEAAAAAKSLDLADTDDLEEVLPESCWELNWTGFTKALLEADDLVVYQDAEGAIKRFNPAQPRDARGRFTSGAGVAGGKHAARNARRRAKRAAQHPPRSRRANGRGTTASRKKLADQIRAARQSVNAVSPEPHSAGRRALLARVRELKTERATAKRLKWELKPKGTAAAKPAPRGKPEPAAKPKATTGVAGHRAAIAGAQAEAVKRNAAYDPAPHLERAQKEFLTARSRYRELDARERQIYDARSTLMKEGRGSAADRAEIVRLRAENDAIRPELVAARRDLDRAELQVKALATYAESRKANPHLIPPGPIAERVARYQAEVGGAKIAALQRVAAAHDAEIGRVAAERAQLVGRIQTREFTLRSLRDQPRKNAARIAEETAADAADRAAHAALKVRHTELTETRRQALEDVLAVDPERRHRFEVKTDAADLPAEYGYGGIDPLNAENRAAVAKAHDFLAKVVGRRDGESSSFAVGQARPDGVQRAHYSNGERLVYLGASDRADVAVHEIGHHMDDRLTTGGIALKERAEEFLRHRVGEESSRPLQDVFPGSHYKADELGRKDRFEDAFGERAWYVGKDYGAGGYTEITSMGVQELYNDPVRFAAKDPEYAAFILGALDGSL